MHLWGKAAHSTQCTANNGKVRQKQIARELDTKEKEKEEMKMKKTMAIILALILVLAFAAGCGNDSKSDANDVGGASVATGDGFDAESAAPTPELDLRADAGALSIDDISVSASDPNATLRTDASSWGNMDLEAASDNQQD